MKIKLPEHDHKLTNILKVLLFSILMLLPFLDIGTRCGYVLLNKNAYQSYYGETINEKQVNAIQYNDMEIGKTYVFSNNEYVDLEPITYRPTINVSNVINLGNTNADLSNVNNLQFFKYPDNEPNRAVIYLRNNNSVISELQPSNTYVSLQFTFEGYGTYSELLSFFNYFKLVTYNEYSYLDNVFDYSIDKMANSPLYNWTTQTGMYTGVNAMTTGLGITTPLFAILITYWMFLTIIYIILDIVLSLFTFMTHIFTKKE